ncbi:unnamed protein product [Dicrocoelium dendriticum]|nr:unnamed protein product [Dicrocoelium dendriticum]
MSPLNNLDNYNLQQRIKEWNATRLDLFKISEPNKRNEFHGVVRFFFQGEDSKYQAKCLRISNTATACQLVNVLVEKFHPDLKRLTAGRYALYEYHASSGERRLGANEAPLMVQLNWAFDDSEVRFVLRDESKPLPSARQRQALENQPSSLQNGGMGAKSKQKPSDNGDHHHGADGHFSRRWSSGSRKKKKKSKDDTHKDSEHDNIPETTFTRTLSNPDEVLRRRRQQRMQHRNQLDGDAKERDGSVKIYGDSINPEVPFITLRLSPDDTADKVVHWTLEKYGVTKQVNPQDYCLVQMNIPPRGERLPLDMERELTLHHQDSPLAIREQVHSMTEHITCVFQIRHRRAIGKDGRRPPPAAPSHPRAPPSSMGTVQRRHTVEHQQPELCSYLIEVSGDSEHPEVPDGLFASVTELFNHSYSGAIRLGTIEKMVGPPPNILVDKNLHPDIRPVHCTFNVVMASTSGSKWRIPSTGQPEELESLTQYSLLVTPSLDGFAKPPGPAAIRLNDTRITGPMILQPGTVLRLGKSLWLKFVQTYETMDDGAEAITPQATMDRRKNGAPSQNLGEKSSIRTGGSHPGVPRRSTPTEVNLSDQKQISQPERSRLSAPPNMRSASGVTEDRLPLTIELQGAAEWTSKTNLLDRYVHLVDQVLRSANADLQIMNTRAKEDNRPVIFSLSPAYALYLVYRACQKQATFFCGSNLSDKEHTVSYITNYIATRVFESLPKVISDSTDRLLIIQPLVYWLANSSELLQFLKHDISLCYPSDSKGQLLESSRYSPPLHACRQALHLLADAVDHCFYELRSCMAILLQPLLYCLVHPGDGDMQDDLRLDDKALLPGSYQDSLQQPTKIQAIMQLFTLLMHQIRRARVNASLTIQLFAQLFHMVNSHIFNQALIKSEAKPRHVRESANVWLSRPGASRLLRRLDRIKHWAQRQGLERAAECRLQKCFQACQLVLADRSNLDDFYQLCMSFLSLNSIQLEWLLSHLTDPPPVPDDWIDLIVTGGREVPT